MFYMDASQTAASGFSILKHFMSIIGVLSQSLLLCWLGERHIQQSLRVKAAAYNCNWCDQSARFKRLLHMIILRAQDPVKFSAGSFFDINIETFDHGNTLA
ncbi:putative odorant receptor 92a isoform X2 [Cryptotermes secundus]|uniref:putative odorant receptor 92a isoform X2 n=1 Tax=Cryptotermes secundus TaxID=105785 RepID=UPI001454DBA5|nr:putative odorant receptor 92a isoform X2 [Cryptotermes secundus]